MKYPERIIKHNLVEPDSLVPEHVKMKEINWTKTISHHVKSIDRYVPYGLVVDGVRYAVKEIFERNGCLIGILSYDEKHFYELQLSFMDDKLIREIQEELHKTKTSVKNNSDRIDTLEKKIDASSQTLSINDRIVSISGGNSIELPPDKDTVYDDSDLQRRVKDLENKPDRDNQRLEINGRTVTITGGNSIELPEDHDTIYDDSALKKRVADLEAKPDNDNQVLTISENNLSISGGNTIQIPITPAYDDSEILNRIGSLETRPDSDKQTLSVSGNNLTISNGNTIQLPISPVYDDTDVKSRINALENKSDNDNQTLSLTDRTITISNGNSITLPEDRDTVYNDTELKNRIQAVESKTDNFVSGVNVSREGNKVKLTYTYIDGTFKEVEFEDHDTVTLAYDDTALKTRVKALEDKPDKDTKYTATGRGLLLNENNQFYLDLKQSMTNSRPYSSKIDKVNLSPSNRYTGDLQSYLSYYIDNDGTPQNNIFMEAGLKLDFNGSYRYKDNIKSLGGRDYTIVLNGVHRSSLQGDFSLTLSKDINIKGNMFATWSDKNNKVVISILAKLVWEINQGSRIERYEHHITKEELDSSDSIQIEIIDGENVVGSLSVTLMNIGFFMKSAQNSIVAKDNADSKYYSLERL